MRQNKFCWEIGSHVIWTLNIPTNVHYFIDMQVSAFAKIDRPQPGKESKQNVLAVRYENLPSESFFPKITTDYSYNHWWTKNHQSSWNLSEEERNDHDHQILSGQTPRQFCPGSCWRREPAYCVFVLLPMTLWELIPYFQLCNEVMLIILYLYNFLLLHTRTALWY